MECQRIPGQSQYWGLQCRNGACDGSVAWPEVAWPEISRHKRFVDSFRYVGEQSAVA
jgi:hypothetical protein